MVEVLKQHKHRKGRWYSKKVQLVSCSTPQFKLNKQVLPLKHNIHLKFNKENKCQAPDYLKFIKYFFFEGKKSTYTIALLFLFIAE